MNSIIRIANAINRVSPANPDACFSSVMDLITQLREQKPDLVVFPQLALTSPGCGNLFENASLLDGCKTALENLCIATKEDAFYLLIGLPIRDCGRLCSVVAVLHAGQILGYIPAVDCPLPFQDATFSSRLLARESVFSCGDLTFCVAACDPMRLGTRAVSYSDTGCDLLIVPAYAPARLGTLDAVRESIRSVSRSMGCAVSLVNGGVGDTSSPLLYRGYSLTCECGEVLAEQCAAYDSFATVCDLDVDIIRACKTYGGCADPVYCAPSTPAKKKLLRPLSPAPYLPQDPQKKDLALEELFDLQVRSLVCRMENTHIYQPVIGISGGLDSTLALLACAKAVDLLDRPRNNIIAITMPGLGTSDQTYYNALSLIERVGADSLDISINAAVMQHFADISQDPEVHDATYENAQARERAQVLFDVANQVHGIVVGTGDLSEAALGWCTFAGDQIANYNVNICIPKSVVRELTAWIARSGAVGDLADILGEILATPISPELLPPDAAGEILQKTEDILGPYELFDFFLYYFVRYGFRASKLYYYACIAFSDTYAPAYIREKLELFFRRFFTAQFKRASAPEAASITDVNLCGVRYAMPSDAQADAFIKELEEIDF